ncbi:MAG: hypothetical protein QXU32_04800 [Nitrososphaerales archaeon]
MGLISNGTKHCLIYIGLVSVLLVQVVSDPAQTKQSAANPFPWITEFTYEMHAPEEVKELSNKTADKYYRLTNVHYEVLGTKVGAGLVVLHLKSKPTSDHETEIDFNVKAKHVYAENDTFNVKKKRAEVNGYSVLDSRTEKLAVRIPWSELLKNV